MTTFTGIDLSNMISEIAEKRALKKDSEIIRERVYDPNGNSHAFQFGAPPAWWDREQRANLDHFSKDPLVLLDAAGGNFTVEKVPTGYFLNGQWIELENQRAVVRTDKKGSAAVLTSSVTKEFSDVPYSRLIQIPDMALDVSDFEDPSIRAFVQEQMDQDLSSNPKINLSDILTPWGCSVWQNGKAITYQYKAGEITPNPEDVDDRYECYLTITSSLDGTMATKFFLTIIRVVCRNTNAHAHAQGWANLSNNEKLRQSLKRTGKMEQHLANWYRSVVEVLYGSQRFANAYSALAKKQFKSISDQKRLAEYICNVFDLDLEKSGRGNRDKATFQKVLEFSMNSDYGQQPRITNWLEAYNGVTAYIQHGRQVNNLAEGEEGVKQREEKLSYKLLVEQDDILSRAWSLVQKAAELDEDVVVEMSA